MNISIIGHPRALWKVAFGKMWDTFSYFGTQTILVLYLIHEFQLSQASSYAVYGMYAVFAYSTPILGGIIADKWIKDNRPLIIGSVLNILGNVLLSTHHHYLFCLGLALSILGSGLFRSTSTHMIGTLYPAGSRAKEMGFTWAYLAVNVGGMSAPIIYGGLVYYLSWNAGFMFSAFGILMSTIWMLNHWTSFNEKSEHAISGWFYVGLMGASFLLSVPFYFSITAPFFIAAMMSAGIVYLIHSVSRYEKQERSHLIGLLMLCFFALFYFSIGLLIGTTITLFIQHQITIGVIHIALPASVFSTLYPFFVLLLAPVFSALWFVLEQKKMSLHVVSKLAVGIGCAVLAMGCFMFAASTHFILSGMVMGILFLSAGELVISPAAYAAISNFAPQGMKNTMMGAWYLCIALGGYVSSVIANASSRLTPDFFHQFLFIGVFALGVLCVFMMVSGALKRLLFLHLQ